MYADFEYYKNNFFGRVIADEMLFNSLCIKAVAYINRITYNRICSDDITDDIKNAVCAVCEVFAEVDGRGGIKSESNDGYSVTYEDDKALYGRLRVAAMLYLPQNLMYAGCDV